MPFLKTTLDQFWKFFSDLPPSQRVSVAAAVLLVAGALGYLAYRGMVPDEEALFAGKQFSAEELRVAQDALRSGGMTEFRVEDMKLYVPRSKAAAYTAALITSESTPAQFGSELSSLHKNMNPFLSNQQRQEMIELAKSQDMCRAFRMIPDIQDASLVWKETHERGLSGGTKTTATLSIRPRTGRSISPTLAHALQRAVASGFSMSPEDVTVLDTTGKVIHGPEEGSPYASQFLERKREFSEHFTRQIEQALQHIPHVIVAVNVELDTLRLSREQTVQFTKPFARSTSETEESDESNQASPSRQPGVRPNTPGDVSQSAAPQNDRRMKKTVNTGENIPGEQLVRHKEFEPLPVKSAQATVSIPEDYFKQIALAKGETVADQAKLDARIKQLRDTTIAEVQKIVAALLPPPVPPAKVEDLVKVNSYDRLNSAAAPVEASLTSTLSDLALQYAGPACLVLFAVWALFSLQRSLPKLPPEPAAAPAVAGKSSPGEAEAAAEDAPRNRLPTPRDRLQSAVRDNPEMAAAVLERWVKTVGARAG